MRKHVKLDDSLRLQIIEEHLSGSSKYSLVRKYKLGNASSIGKWMHIFGIMATENHAVEEPFLKKRKADANKSSEVLVLEKEIKLLKTRLAYSEMKAEAYDTMIDLAEREYQIKIRKNSNTK
ncbi:hypothetical protein EZS27_015419 [termite gut metagenome]|jgi:hypothetical protein|uniref:Transposase n=2 Tax=termite gut metagenome TaxID=433724 RepID=A0A5J4RRS5_9ZZZZ